MDVSVFLFGATDRQTDTPVDHGLLIHEVSRSHATTHYIRWDSSGLVISPTQRPLPDNTQHSQETNMLQPAGFGPAIPAGERPQTYALDRVATGTGVSVLYVVKITACVDTTSVLP